MEFKPNIINGKLTIAVAGEDSAERAVEINTADAKRLARLRVQQIRLESCQTALIETMNRNTTTPDQKFHIIVGVVIKFYSCFDQSQKVHRLDQNAIYGKQEDGLDSFNFWKDIRDKHISHDTNAYWASRAIMSIRPDGELVEVYVPAFRVGIEENIPPLLNLMSLINSAKNWVDSTVADLRAKVIAEASSMSPEARAALPTFQYVAPDKPTKIRKQD